MSSLPGLDLESYVMWNHDLVVDNDDSANKSLMLAEALGNVKPRPRLIKEQFAPILALYEPFREEIENKLSEFDEENQSWRDYAGYAFDNVEVSWQKINSMLIQFREPHKMVKGIAIPDPWPTRGPEFNAWYTHLTVLTELLATTNEDSWWGQDPNLKYLNIRIDTRRNTFRVFIDIPNGGPTDAAEEINPMRIVNAIETYYDMLHGRYK